MKSSFKSIIIASLCVALAISCSRKKDKFINRNFHAVTAEYNTLFNGYNALEEGREALNNTYFDNYWDILPVERLEVFDDVILPGQSKNENFSRAEEKAIKAIQKHGMNIEGKERNPQIDEAYILLGKSRYFDQRFIPALESFNYILYKYPASDKINQAKVWREKCNIRLDNNELAIKNLKRLLKQESLERQDLADATSILAQAYINTKALDSAITQLDIAATATKSNDERGRFRFIQGQLYNALGVKDSANMAFDKVIVLNRKTPRIYMIVAQLEKINNFNVDSGNKFEVATLLRELEENRENRPFLDKIYHQTAEFYLKNESDALAINFYNKSLRTNSRDKYLKARNYERLGDMYFEASVYADAGAYYDSTMTNLVLNSKPYRVIKKKRDNLKDVIYYEAIAKTNDSILNLVNLSEADRLAYFNEHVEALKVKAQIEKEQAEVDENNSGLATVNNQIGALSNAGRGVPNQATLFYFYNPTTVAYGKNEFVKVWGDRTNDDDWRWSNKISTGVAGNISNSNDLDAISEEEKFNPQFYLSKIPSNQKTIDSISNERNYAYYQLGLIYKEKFQEYDMAKNRFQDLLKSNPEERLKLPSKYNLYKIYELLGDHDEAQIAKADIIASYPDSRYAAILQHPELGASEDENSAENLYEKLYELHENQQYAQVITNSDTYITQFDGEPIVPKFELLKAMATGRLFGYEAYKKAINRVAVTYANTSEGKQAQHIEDQVLPQIAKKEFVVSSDSILGHYKVVFKFKDKTPKEVNGFKSTLDTVLKNVKYYKLKSSKDIYSPNTTFIVVHGLHSKRVADTFDQIISEKDKEKIKIPYFAISSENYQIIQIHKNLEAYSNLYNN
ncbi:tetratricopeptide repeat protein [Tamlana fucoidanivorans]|uniref:type IX secretion system periplasmic lipoprotein PorW/SprE n=1 Tax=Allotamlana fucoidanivorans TaxID=2583814 RepID=UPI001E41B4F2|nr:tetratricopeptide repeat protein [Tamlana fucoidanivorans]